MGGTTFSRIGSSNCCASERDYEPRADWSTLASITLNDFDGGMFDGGVEGGEFHAFARSQLCEVKVGYFGRRARSFQIRKRLFIRLETALRMRLPTCVCEDLWCRNLTWVRSILFLESDAPRLNACGPLGQQAHQMRPRWLRVEASLLNQACQVISGLATQVRERGKFLASHGTDLVGGDFGYSDGPSLIGREFDLLTVAAFIDVNDRPNITRPLFQQRFETRLREMVVAGQRVRDFLLCHHGKRYAIRQRPVFVWALLVELQAALKPITPGTHNSDLGVSGQVTNERGHRAPAGRISQGVRDFRQHPLGRDNLSVQLAGRGGCLGVVLVGAVQQRHEVKGVREDPVHFFRCPCT